MPRCLKAVKKRFTVQWMETQNLTFRGTEAVKQVERRFLLEKSWKHGLQGATLVLQVTLLERQSTSHSA